MSSLYSARSSRKLSRTSRLKAFGLSGGHCLTCHPLEISNLPPLEMDIPILSNGGEVERSSWILKRF